MKKKSSGAGLFLTGFILALVLILAALIVYVINWYSERARIRGDAARYQALYSPAATPTPGPTPSALPVAEDDPIPTPDADTLVYALPTAPPVQASFRALLAENPETVGFLSVGDVVSLPVVQRPNDNDYYLTHSFDGSEAQEGTLFLDGSNLLVPEDDCLIIYGHNMKNGTMFGRLDTLGKAAALQANAVVRFDTLYENRLYVPFAAFTASMDRASPNYFEVRRFLLEPEEFDGFAASLKARSKLDIPVDVARGDAILLLVTCDYTNADGRFILALRRLRPDETGADAARMVGEAK